MSDIFLKVNTALNGFVWGPYMLIGLVGVGVYLTLRTGCIQFAKFGLMWRETLGQALRKSEGGEGDVTPLQAMTVAMGGSVGVGNIAGVATAIAIGGRGQYSGCSCQDWSVWLPSSPRWFWAVTTVSAKKVNP